MEAKWHGTPPERKRLFRSGYQRITPFLRAFLLFLYRYIVRGGFRDGRAGLIFFVLQTFWFRFLIDAKLFERGLKSGPNQENCLHCGATLLPLQEQLYDTRFGLPQNYQILCCSVCALEHTSPRPQPEELQSWYATHYNADANSRTGYNRWRARFLHSPLYRLWLRIDGDLSFHDRSSATLPSSTPDAETDTAMPDNNLKRLLDVGCNEGRSLPLYQANGFACVEGLETNAVAAATARESGFIIHEKDLADFSHSHLFDVVVLSNVLEHALDPKIMLQHVHRILKPGGQLWISCPNAKSWLRALSGGRWINWHVPFHITHFNAENLAALVEKTGFRCQQSAQVTPALWVAQTLISACTAKRGRPTTALRNKWALIGLMLLCRLFFWPLLWAGNRLGRGDALCLIAQA